MNNLKLQLFVLIFSSIAGAQVSTETLSQEVDAEINKMYSEQPSVVTTKATSPSVTQVSQTTVVTAQKQPVTVIEATPLSNSSAESIRKNRMEEEMRTETRIVEKLEQSRMEDEKKRAAVLFGDKFEKINKKTNQAVTEVAEETETVPVVAPVSHIQAQPIVIQQAPAPAPTITKDDIHNEVRAALDEDKEEASAETISLFEKKYIGAIAGVPQYSEANGVQGNYSLGFVIGTSNDFIQIEGGFLYSNYFLGNALYVDQMYYTQFANFLMNQYQTFVATKFQLMSGDIRPAIGGLASYSMRKYKSDSFTSYGAPGTDFGSSNSIDLGLTAGIDLLVNSKFSIGADMKYMFNVSSNINGSTALGAKSPEKLSYYLLGLTAKMMF